MATIWFAALLHFSAGAAAHAATAEPACDAREPDCSERPLHADSAARLLTAAAHALNAWKEWKERPEQRHETAILAVAHPERVGKSLKRSYKAAATKAEKSRWKAWYLNWQGSKLHLVRIAQAGVQEYLGKSEEALQLCHAAADAALNGGFWGKGKVPCRGPAPQLLETVPQSWEDTWCAHGISRQNIVDKHQEAITCAIRLTLQLQGADAAAELLQLSRAALPNEVPWKDPWQLPLEYNPAFLARPIWDTDEGQWSWLADIERLAPAIRSNLSHLLSVTTLDQWELSGDRLIVDPSGPAKGWSEWLLFDGGRWMEQACGAFADTCKVLAALPQVSGAVMDPQRNDRFINGQITILRLRAGAHLKPHFGVSNRRLTGHLGIVTPEGAALELANRTVHWTSGKAIVFDDSFHHEAWNRGSEDRFVMYFSIWHPDVRPLPQLLPPEFYVHKLKNWHPLYQPEQVG